MSSLLSIPLFINNILSMSLIEIESYVNMEGAPNSLQSTRTQKNSNKINVDHCYTQFKWQIERETDHHAIA